MSKKDDFSRTIAYILMAVLGAGCIFSIIGYRLDLFPADKQKKAVFAGAIEELEESDVDFGVDENGGGDGAFAQSTEEENSSGALYGPETGYDDIRGKMLVRDGDEDYFRPITDDYMYVVEYLETNINDGDLLVDAEQDILFSFNEKGEVIQAIRRRIDNYYNMPQFSMESYWGEGGYDHVLSVSGDVCYCDLIKDGMDYSVSGGILTEKGQRLRELIIYPDEYDDFYMSVPDSNLSVPPTESFAFGPEDFVVTEYFTPETEDYLLSRMDVGNAVLQYKNITGVQIERMQCFDESGATIQFRFVYVFANAEDALDYYDAVGECYGEEAQKAIEKPTGNIVVPNYRVNEYNDKISWEEGLDYKGETYIDMEHSYWTMPYLTYSQFEIFCRQ